MRLAQIPLLLFPALLLCQCAPEEVPKAKVPAPAQCYFTKIGGGPRGDHRFAYGADGTLSYLYPTSINSTDTIFFSYDAEKRVTGIMYGKIADTLRYSTYTYVPGITSWKYAYHRGDGIRTERYDTAFYGAAGQRVLVKSSSTDGFNSRIEMSYLDGNIEDMIKTTARLNPSTGAVDSSQVRHWKYKWDVIDNPYAFFENLNWGDPAFDIEEVIHTPNRKAPLSYDIYNYRKTNGSWHLSPESVHCVYQLDPSGLIGIHSVVGNSTYQPSGSRLFSECK